MIERISQDSYSICFFVNAKQGSVNLGSFDGWDLADPSVMLFSHGQRCHDGPARSLRVRIVCGGSSESLTAVGELLDLTEPSRCMYEATVAHWSVCGNADLEGIREQLALIDEGSRQEL